MSRARIMRLPALDGGEANIFSPSKWPIKYSLLMQNCWINERGNLAKIPGYIPKNLTSTGVEMTGGHEFIKTDGTSFLLVNGGTSIYCFNPSTNEFGVIQGSLPQGRCQYTTFNNTCIIVNGVNVPMKTTDGASVEILGGSPPLTTFKTHVHKGRIWFLERTNKLMASCSARNDPETQEGYIDFKYVLKKGDELVDIFTYIDLLVFVFKNHIAIYSGNVPSDPINPDNVDFRLVQLIEGMGGKDYETVQGFGTDTAFLTTTGVKTFKQVVTTGNLNKDDLSGLIDPDLQPTVDVASIFASAHYPRLGWYLLKVDNIIRVYDYVAKSWHRIVGADCNAMFTTMAGKLYFLGNGFMYEYGVPNIWDFAGANPEMKWTLGWLNLSPSGRKTSPKILEITAYPQVEAELELSITYDLKPAGESGYYTVSLSPQNVTIIDDVLDPPGFDSIAPFDESAFEIYRTKLHGKGRIMQMQFRNTSNKQIELADFALTVVEGGF